MKVGQVAMIKKVFLGLATILATASAEAQVTAFPGAEGYGRFAIGGRGGAVHRVTSLANSGPGTLRACVEASGPRTCVFAVSGTLRCCRPCRSAAAGS